MNKIFLAVLLFLCSATLAMAETKLEVKNGQKFTLTLVSNPSTGYGWQLAQPVDETKVKLLESKYNALKTDRAGAAGVELWIFEAKTPGETSISLKYVRPWEKDVAPAETATFAITIK